MTLGAGESERPAAEAATPPPVATVVAPTLVLLEYQMAGVGKQLERHLDECAAQNSRVDRRLGSIDGKVQGITVDVALVNSKMTEFHERLRDSDKDTQHRLDKQDKTLGWILGLIISGLAAAVLGAVAAVWYVVQSLAIAGAPIIH